MRTRRISKQQRTTTLLPPGAASAALLFLLAAPSLTSAFTIRNLLIPKSQTSPLAEDLSTGSSSCGDSSYVQCGNGLPSDFCCPTSSTCMSLAGGTTALCCPTGGNCTQIETIPCELSLEDKSQHPAAEVMTTALTGTLETCGDQCCPFGYSCTSGNVCEVNDDQSAKPSTSSVASSATATSSSGGSSGSSGSSATASAEVTPTTGTDSSSSATATASSGSGSGADGTSTASSAADSTSTSSSSGDSSPEASSSSQDSSSRAGVVAGGVIGGIAAAICLGLLIMFFVKREMKRRQQQKGEEGGGDGSGSSRSSSFGNILSNPVTRGGSTRAQISKPILHDDGTLRSDFSRKVTPHAPQLASDPPGGATGLGLHEYYGGGEQSSEKSPAVASDGWTEDDEDDDQVGSLRNVPRSPPNMTTPNPRAVSSLYGELYMDTSRASNYPGPLRMPSARHYGGFDHPVDGVVGGVSADNNPVSEYGANGGGQRTTRDPNAAYIDVFADEYALSPHSLGPPRRFGEGQPGDRETRFSDFGRQNL